MRRAYLFCIVLPLLLTSIVACESKQERARNNLKKLGIQFTSDSFVESAKNGDLVAVENFLEAGINPDVKNDADCSAMFYAKIQNNEKLRSLLKEYRAGEINADKMLGKWACENPYFSEINIYSKDGKYFYQTTTATFKAELRNDDTLVFPIKYSYRPPIVIEVKLGEDDTLEVSNIIEKPLIFKRILK